jgi:hypothetical protein
MCHFVSWVESGKAVFYLTHKQVWETERGKELREHCGNKEDYVGHGAIRFYYKLGEVKGRNCEVTDFSSTANLPEEIVSAIKNGEFAGMATPEGLLSQPALAECQQVEQSAWAEYQQVVQDMFWGLFANPSNRAEEWK